MATTYMLWGLGVMLNVLERTRDVLYTHAHVTDVCRVQAGGAWEY